MKTFKTTQLAILLLLIISCSDTKKEAESDSDYSPTATTVWNPECDPSIKANAKSNEVIVKIDSCAFKLMPKKALKAVDNIRKEWDLVDERVCPCDPTIRLLIFKEDSTIGQEERLASANDKLKTEGNGIPLGSAILNFELDIDDPGKVDQIYKYHADSTPINSQMVVAVIDGGIIWSEQDLNKYKWINPNTNCYTNRFDLTTHTEVVNYHGTLVSRFIVSNLDKNKIKLMDLRIFDNDGHGSLFDAACAMSFAINNNADIINTSWGYYTDLSNPVYLDLVNEAKKNDIIIVSSGGNDSSDNDKCPHYPSGIDDKFFKQDNVIGVAYLNNIEDDLSEHSNWGKRSLSVAARGIFGTIEGSSYAAPQVTRAIAIIKGNNETQSHKTIIDHVFNSNIVKLDSLKHKVITEGKLKDIINYQIPVPR